jgi:hypothetical protein
MADLTEVASKLVQIIAAAVYPNGTSQPSVTGAPVLVYQGWPNPQQLAQDLAAGKIHISVFPRPGDKVTSVTSGDAEWVEQSNNGTVGISTRELRRQTRQFQITIWASCYEKRDPLASAVDIALASITRMDFADGSQGQLTYVNSTQDDNQQNQGIYRRDLFYAVNYATVQTETDYVIKQTALLYSIGPTLTAQGDTHTITNP